MRPELNATPEELVDVSPVIFRIIADCWDETPGRRPDIRTVRGQLKGIMKGQ